MSDPMAERLAASEEFLRQCHERRLLERLDLNLERRHHMERLRWVWVVLILVMIKELSEPARFMLSYGGSWAYKVSESMPVDWIIPAWLLACAGLLVPLAVVMMVRPAARIRRTAEGLASAGLGGGGFAFAAIAFIAHAKFDAPQAVDAWTWSCVTCMVSMLLLAAGVNSRQNLRRERSAAAPGETLCA